MPELPDLEAIRGFLAPRLRGKRVEATELRYPWLVRSEDGLDSLTGRRFTDVRRHGKFLIFDTDDDRLMVVNPMLSGRFQWAGPDEHRRAGACVMLAFSGGHQLRYSDARRMGRWYVVAADALDSIPQFGDLGPDAMEVDQETFLTRLKRRRGQAKNVLTNQRFIAGIGNAYSDEILWEARIHPHRRIATMDEEERRGLYRAMCATLAWAMPILEAEVADGLDQRNEEWRGHLRVHRRAGEPCPRCGAEVKAQVRGGSETNYCLTCQPLAL